MKTKEQEIKENQIKCFDCKKYFDSVTTFSETASEDYEKKKWFCDECFHKECFNKGKKQAREEIEKMIEKLKRYSLDDDGGCDDPECCGGRSYFMSESDDGEYIKLKELKSQIKEEK